MIVASKRAGLSVQRIRATFEEDKMAKLFMSRIGLPPTATAEEIVDRCHQLGDLDASLREASRPVQGRPPMNRELAAFDERSAARLAGTTRPDASKSSTKPFAKAAERFVKYRATCALEGRQPLSLEKWQEHDAVVNPGAVELERLEREAPAMMAEQRIAAIVRERPDVTVEMARRVVEAEAVVASDRVIPWHRLFITKHGEVVNDRRERNQITLMWRRGYGATGVELSFKGAMLSPSRVTWDGFEKECVDTGVPIL